MLFQPKFWSKERKIVLTILYGVTVIAFFIISDSLMDLYLKVGLVQEVRNTILSSLAVFAVLWVVPILASVWAVKHQSIEISNGLLFSKSQVFLQSVVYKTINLKTVEVITDKVEKRIVPAGRSIMVVTFFHLVFEHAKGERDTISLAGWDKESVMGVLKYIHRKYPTIFIQTFAYREDSKKILKEYLPLVKK